MLPTGAHRDWPRQHRPRGGYQPNVGSETAVAEVAHRRPSGLGSLVPAFESQTVTKPRLDSGKHPFVCRNLVPAGDRMAQILVNEGPGSLQSLARGRICNDPVGEVESVIEERAREHVADGSNASRKISPGVEGPRD